MLPEVALRQWVLTFPFAWRRRLAHDGALLGALTRLFIETILAFYAEAGALQWLRGLAPLSPSTLSFDKPLCAALDGFTLHAATRAGALDVEGREALLRYVLRPPLAQDRLEMRPDGLVARSPWTFSSVRSATGG